MTRDEIIRMAQEPVAWMVADRDDRTFIFCMQKPMAHKGETLTPLYTHAPDDTALLRQALEALEKASGFMRDSDYVKLNQTIDVLRKRLNNHPTTKE